MAIRPYSTAILASLREIALFRHFIGKRTNLRGETKENYDRTTNVSIGRRTRNKEEPVGQAEVIAAAKDQPSRRNKAGLWPHNQHFDRQQLKNSRKSE